MLYASSKTIVQDMAEAGKVRRLSLLLTLLSTHCACPNLQNFDINENTELTTEWITSRLRATLTRA